MATVAVIECVLHTRSRPSESRQRFVCFPLMCFLVVVVVFVAHWSDFDWFFWVTTWQKVARLNQGWNIISSIFSVCLNFVETSWSEFDQISTADTIRFNYCSSSRWQAKNTSQNKVIYWQYTYSVWCSRGFFHSDSLPLSSALWSWLIDMSGMMGHHGVRAGLQLSHVTAADGTAEY